MSGLFDDTMRYLLSAADDDTPDDSAETLILGDDAAQHEDVAQLATWRREMEALPFDAVSEEDKP